MLEVFLRAVALPLRENTKHELNLAIKRSKFARNLHDDILLEFLAVDQVSCCLLEQVLTLSTF